MWYTIHVTKHLLGQECHPDSQRLVTGMQQYVLTGNHITWPPYNSGNHHQQLRGGGVRKMYLNNLFYFFPGGKQFFYFSRSEKQIFFVSTKR